MVIRSPRGPWRLRVELWWMRRRLDWRQAHRRKWAVPVFAVAYVAGEVAEVVLPDRHGLRVALLLAVVAVAPFAPFGVVALYDARVRRVRWLARDRALWRP